MELGRHLDLGALATGSANYEGQHRFGIRHIPLGDRSREVQEYGIDWIEERGNDKLSKYLKKM